MFNFLTCMLRNGRGHIPLPSPLKLEETYIVRNELDREHHWWKKAESVAVDIYKDGTVVVIVRDKNGKDYILECN